MSSALSVVGFKYEGLYRAIRQSLELEPLPESGPLFTEKELEERYGASRTTIRKALTQLETEGFIVRKQRLGTFPGAKLLSNPAPANLSGQTERAADLSSRVPVKESATRWITPPPHVKEELRLGSKVDVLEFSRVRDAGDAALVSMTSWFRPDVGQTLDVEQLYTSPPITLFERAGFPISHTIQRVTARAASVEMAKRLQVKKGSVVFVIKSTILDVASSPMSYAEHCSPADRFELRSKIEPDGAVGLSDIVRLPKT